MRVRQLLILSVMVFFGACLIDIETNERNLEIILDSQKLVIVIESFNGIGGGSKSKMEFNCIKDSVKVEYNGVDKSQKTQTITAAYYSEIKNQIRCLETNHNDKEDPVSGCIISSPNQYYLINKNKRMRLFDPKTNCELDQLLFKIYEFNLLDLIDKFG